MKQFLQGAAVALFGITYLIALSACAPSRDDGMGDLWRGVKYIEEQRK